ncbi:hypothetical protein RM549_13045 [Salegentibacter sp. F188]|uniref:Uncharacterized protein n=1 Tax=Autumnicola patrickiae TaxID=3075591 RepID=A0ABU3E507_9FLAO|nr:hypothetical protein [Salegentibacter sp. F188]MDT0690719.1 hypothetical protein [Salegentibacter sp. F188]
MLAVTKHEDFDTASIFSVKMIFWINLFYLLPERKKLAKAKFYNFVVKVHVKAPAFVALVRGKMTGSVQ